MDNQPFGKAQIADGVRLERGVILVDRLVIEHDAWIEAGVIFADGGLTDTIIRSKARIGAGAVIGPGVDVGVGAHVIPGSVVLKPVPPNAIVQGNPAQIRGYTQGIGATDDNKATFAPPPDNEDRIGVNRTLLGVGEAAVYCMTRVTDLRGSLTVGEFGETFPFTPARYFVVYDVPSEELRGEHAHKACHQFLVCVRGSCRALLDNGETRRDVVLDRPDVGLHMPPMIWGTQFRYTRDAMLLVLASHPYDPNDYIRTYDEFLMAINKARP